jgi:hypothetical protein
MPAHCLPTEQVHFLVESCIIRNLCKQQTADFLQALGVDTRFTSLGESEARAHGGCITYLIAKCALL